MNESDSTGLTSTKRPVKSEAAFRTISEVSDDLDVPQHVLRFWESKFTQIKPLKRGGGRRYYRPEDVALLVRIRDLLYRDGYTIRGAQKFLRETAKPARGPEPVRSTGAARAKPETAPDAPPVVDQLPLAPPAGMTKTERTELSAILTELRSLMADVALLKAKIEN